MKMNKILLPAILVLAVLVSCNDDDTEDFVPVPDRDRAEVDAEDQLELQTYLETHFYNYEEFENPSEDFDYVVRFDTIAGENIDKIALIDRPELYTKTVEEADIDYNLYVLKVREGVGRAPTAADSTYVTYRGELLTNDLFDSSVQPIWFDLPGGLTASGLIPGFTAGITEFKDASGFVENTDGTITFNDDYGIGAVFFPSGIGYFSGSVGIIPTYSPLIFSFKLFVSNQADHDNDGIPSFLEDATGENSEFESGEDTDSDGGPNYLDADDDNDGVLTRDEIISEDLNNDGVITIDEIIFTDSNNDGIADYLQADVDGSPEEEDE
ncbi:MAG: hypothetical protein CL817_00090 [Croceibacter sp.]|jgi:hypothetical protein|nr:hypothetical protein [Croceibacter sp.]